MQYHLFYTSMLSQNIDNTIPSFFTYSEWSVLFKYLASLFTPNSGEPLHLQIWSSNLTYSSDFFSNLFVSLFSLRKYFPTILSIIVLIFLFGSLHKCSAAQIWLETRDLIERLWVIAIIYQLTFFLLYSAFKKGTVLPLFLNNLTQNLDILAAYIKGDEIYYNNIISLTFLVILFALHLFMDPFLKFNVNKVVAEVPLLIYLVSCFSLILLEVTDLGLFIICLEGFSLTLYILATTGRKYGGIGAAIKYFVFGTLGSILLYWGSVNLFELTATMRISSISELFVDLTEVHNTSSTVYNKAVLAQSLVLLGLLIKLGAAPFHQWIPDVYAGVPLFITAFYSVFVKFVLFILFLKFASNFSSVYDIEFIALLSIIIGCFGALRQVEIKRFLAYGSIAHTGYLLMGDLTSAYIYLITYVLATFIFFLILLNTRLMAKEFIYISDLRFMDSAHTVDRTLLAIVLASMAGLPPFAGFYGKMLVWVSLIEDIYLYNDFLSYVLLTLNLVTSLIMMFYYMQVMSIIYIKNQEPEAEYNPMINSDDRILPNELLRADWNPTSYNCGGAKLTGLILILLWTFLMPSILSVVTNLI